MTDYTQSFAALAIAVLAFSILVGLVLGLMWLDSRD